MLTPDIFIPQLENRNLLWISYDKNIPENYRGFSVNVKMNSNGEIETETVCLFHPKSGSSSNLVQVILSWKALPFVLTVQIQPCHTSLFSCFLICLRDPLQLHYSKG